MRVVSDVAEKTNGNETWDSAGQEGRDEFECQCECDRKRRASNVLVRPSDWLAAGWLAGWLRLAGSLTCSFCSILCAGLRLSLSHFAHLASLCDAADAVPRPTPDCSRQSAVCVGPARESCASCKLTRSHLPSSSPSLQPARLAFAVPHRCDALVVAKGSAKAAPTSMPAPLSHSSLLAQEEVVRLCVARLSVCACNRASDSRARLALSVCRPPVASCQLCRPVLLATAQCTVQHTCNRAPPTCDEIGGAISSPVASVALARPGSQTSPPIRPNSTRRRHLLAARLSATPVCHQTCLSLITPLLPRPSITGPISRRCRGQSVAPADSQSGRTTRQDKASRDGTRRDETSSATNSCTSWLSGANCNACLAANISRQSEAGPRMGQQLSEPAPISRTVKCQGSCLLSRRPLWPSSSELASVSWAADVDCGQSQSSFQPT